MATEENASPSNGSSTSDQDLTELRNKLDGLLERYLNLLDQYDQARNRLAKHMSAGFFALAEANFKNSARTRYGQDYYDARMQATKRVIIDLDEHHQSYLCMRIPADQTSALSTNQTTEEGQQPTPPQTPLTTAASGATTEKNEAAEPVDESSRAVPPEESPEESKSKSEVPEKGLDPLKWFGYFVSPSLRTCQQCFTSAIDEPLILSANASRSLRDTEVEIRKLRKEIRRSEKRTSAAR